MIAWDVYNCHGNVVDTVWYTSNMTAEEVVRDLLKSSHYDSATTVQVNKG